MLSPPLDIVSPKVVPSSISILGDDDDDDDDDVISDVMGSKCISSQGGRLKSNRMARRRVSIKMPDGEDSDDENTDSDDDDDDEYGVSNDDVKRGFVDDGGCGMIMSPQSKPIPSSPPATSSGSKRLQMKGMMTSSATSSTLSSKAAATTTTTTATATSPSTASTTVSGMMKKGRESDESHFVQSGISQVTSNPCSLNKYLKNFIPIDRFFGFYHYYHNNKDHALAWWRNYCLEDGYTHTGRK